MAEATRELALEYALRLAELGGPEWASAVQLVEQAEVVRGYLEAETPTGVLTLDGHLDTEELGKAIKAWVRRSGRADVNVAFGT